MKTVTYTTLALSERDQIFLKSIIVIYNTRGQAIWQMLPQQANLDVLFVGKGVDRRQFLKVSRNINIVISLDENIIKESGHTIYLNLPLRATELTDKLKQVETILKRAHLKPTKSNQLKQTTNKLRLMQWPKAEIINQDTAYRLLAALLSRRAMSLVELVTISKQSEEVCKTFIELLQKAGCVEYMIVSTITQQTLDDANKREVVPSSKKGLLDKIRRKLGLFH